MSHPTPGAIFRRTLPVLGLGLGALLLVGIWKNLTPDQLAGTFGFVTPGALIGAGIACDAHWRRCREELWQAPLAVLAPFVAIAAVPGVWFENLFHTEWTPGQVIWSVTVPLILGAMGMLLGLVAYQAMKLSLTPPCPCDE